ncbi:MAG: hypothetical protein IKR48_05445, partial [Kiritimatiellae bacterium]|nr:hypothetical protein [Kiritimatiellia bacterium]
MNRCFSATRRIGWTFLLSTLLTFPFIWANAQSMQTLTSSSAGTELTGGKTYTIDNNLTLNAGAGKHGLAIKSGTSVTIYIPENKTLTVNGGAGGTPTAAGAGIYCPDGATLILTGAGKLVAKGGNAGSGGAGGSASSPSLTKSTTTAGTGGNGGAGGGGAGPGVGGAGGKGGNGGTRDCWESAESTSYSNGNYDHTGPDGGSGGKGGDSTGGGSVYVLGTVTLEATGGSAGSGGSRGSCSSGRRETWTWRWWAGG